MAQDKAERRVGYYIRVSTERQARVVEGSLKNQRQMLDTELERRNQQSPGWGVFVNAYVDEGLSGKNTNRPAFQRMMQDLEVGRIDTVMFTELSRLSRSLKDFLNIFEFAQKHQCDLVCLRTDIDTTSPYKSLITKILMILAEFERELTSKRTAANAYERGRRGLANGGVPPLGYRRDKRRKGYFVVDAAGSRAVQALFATYLDEQSIKRTVAVVGKSYPRLKLTRSKVHSILTNKTYIGVRRINTHDETQTQEVPAVWKPIIDVKTYQKVQAALHENRDQYNRHADSGRFVYLFTGLFRCGECGQRLQGKSAQSSGRHYHYYAHRQVCPEGGKTRIDAALVHRVVLGWLQDIAAHGERFEKLRKEGAQRIGRRIAELRRALKRINDDRAATVAQIDARIGELTRVKADAVRRSIQASISRLEAHAEEKRQEGLYAEQEIGQLEALVNDPQVYEHYRKAIRAALTAAERDAQPGRERPFANVVAGLALTQGHIRIALSGVSRSGAGSTLSVLAPGSGLKANRPPVLIEHRIPLPRRFLLSDPAHLANLHERDGLSALQIARRLDVSHSAVKEALGRFGMEAHGGRNRHRVKGQAPFGWDLHDARFVKNNAEQQVIRVMRQLQGGGTSLRGIVGELNRRLVPTKNAGVWQANTVRTILHRLARVTA